MSGSWPQVHGISQQELDMCKADMESSCRTQLAEAEQIESGSLADTGVEHFLRGECMLSVTEEVGFHLFLHLFRSFFLFGSLCSSLYFSVFLALTLSLSLSLSLSFSCLSLLSSLCSLSLALSAHCHWMQFYVQECCAMQVAITRALLPGITTQEVTAESKNFHWPSNCVVRISGSSCPLQRQYLLLTMTHREHTSGDTLSIDLSRTH